MSVMPLKIVIPSHKRHDRVFAKKIVKDPIICVAESQADIYKRYNPECEIVSHPDDIIGLIPKRNSREHSYSLTYAKKAVNEAQKNYDLAKKLWL